MIQVYQQKQVNLQNDFLTNRYQKTFLLKVWNQINGIQPEAVYSDAPVGGGIGIGAAEGSFDIKTAYYYLYNSKLESGAAGSSAAEIPRPTFEEPSADA